MLRRNIVIDLGAFLFSICCVVYAKESSAYFVKRGETFSQIAQRYLGNPVYKPRDGSLARLKKLNPDIQNPDRIYPGEKVFLGEALRQVASAQLPSAPAITQTPKNANPQNPSQIPSSVNAGDLPLSHLGVDAGFEFFRLNSVDKSDGTTATLISNQSPILHLSWDLDWTSKWTSSLLFSYQSYKIQDDTSLDPRPIGSGSGELVGFDAALTRKWSKNSRTSASVGLEDRLFEHSPSPTEVDMDVVGTPLIKVTEEQDFVRVRTASFGGSLTGEALFRGQGAGYDTDFGYGGEASLYLKHEMKSLTIKGQVYYGLEKQDSSIVTQSGNEMGAMIGFSWNLGE